MLSVSFDFIRT